METEQNCWQALFTGDLRKAAEGFDALRRQQVSVNAEAGLFLSFVFAGASEPARSILSEREQRHDDLGLLLWRAAWIGASNNLPQALSLLEKFMTSVNAPKAWWAPLYYGYGHIAALAQDKTTAIRQFTEAGQAFAADALLYLKNEDPSLRSVVFQSMHMLTEETVDMLASQNDWLGPELTWLNKPDPVTIAKKQPVFVAAADPHYLHLYGAGFVTSLLDQHPESHIHLHIADGRPEDLQTVTDTLDASRLHQISASLSSTDRWPVHKPPVYASTRFLIAPVLLKAFAAPVLLLDIDSAASRPLDPLLTKTLESDISCWVRPDGGPGGYTAAGAVGFSPGTGSKVASLAAAYIDRRLSEEASHLWFVDQAALFRAAHHFETADNGTFRWGDFSPAGAFESFFDHAPESPDKRR